tara:strand:+ start:113 stop:328 length:216 start_codon:yes stop_codon:yes gene_type:complete
MENNIQNLFALLDGNQQKQLIKVLAEHYKKKPLSIRNNWFSGYKQIPAQYHSEVLRILQRRIELFNLTPQS